MDVPPPKQPARQLASFPPKFYSEAKTAKQDVVRKAASPTPQRFQKHFGMQRPCYEAFVWLSYPALPTRASGFKKQPAMLDLPWQPWAALVGSLVDFQRRHHDYPSVLPVTLLPVCS